MTARRQGPQWWANRGSVLLRQALGENRFPIDVEMLATDWSKHLAPDAPITKVAARRLESFEGALVDGRDQGKGWGIAYNKDIRSEGRKRFTIAHELGHFLLHRNEGPQGGFSCGQQDLAIWDHDRNPQEAEANCFAAGILMPLDDFRAQVPAKASIDMDSLSELARDRYGVSLTACILRWLEYTERRAMLVVSREGYILWAKPSRPAYRSGIFLRTRQGPPLEMPLASPLATSDPFLISGEVIQHPARAWPWFQEPVCEEIIVADRYDLGLSLLTFAASSARSLWAEEREPDVLDLMSR